MFRLPEGVSLIPANDRGEMLHKYVKSKDIIARQLRQGYDCFGKPLGLRVDSITGVMQLKIERAPAPGPDHMRKHCEGAIALLFERYVQKRSATAVKAGQLHLNWVKASKCFRIPFQVGIRHRELFEWWHVDGKFE